MLKAPVYCYKEECRRAPHSIHHQRAMEIDLLCLYKYEKWLQRGTAHFLILTWHQDATSTQTSIPSNQAEQILSRTGLKVSSAVSNTTEPLAAWKSHNNVKYTQIIATPHTELAGCCSSRCYSEKWHCGLQSPTRRNTSSLQQPSSFLHTEI